MEKQRLQKILSQAGLGSRREIEEWITKGLVAVNGAVAKLGDSATVQDKVTVHGKLVGNCINYPQPLRVLLYHKVVGEICSRKDPKYPKTVFDNLPKLRSGRWIMIGRLDLNTSGLLIFTNNGDLANHMMHPRYEIEREYAARVRGQVTELMIQTLLKGVMLDDGPAKFKSIEYRGGEGVNAWYHVVITDGKNREVRRLWETQGLLVSRLMRVRYGDVKMPRWLARGKTNELDSNEVEILLKKLGLMSLLPSTQPIRR